MVLGIAVLLLAPLGATNVQLRIALVGETHTAVELHRAVTGVEQGFSGVGLGHAAGDFSILIQRALSHQRRGVVDKGCLLYTSDAADE